MCPKAHCISLLTVLVEYVLNPTFWLLLGSKIHEVSGSPFFALNQVLAILCGLHKYVLNERMKNELEHHTFNELCVYFSQIATLLHTDGIMLDIND
jgi:hypothetical protein